MSKTRTNEMPAVAGDKRNRDDRRRQSDRRQRRQDFTGKERRHDDRRSWVGRRQAAAWRQNS